MTGKKEVSLFCLRPTENNGAKPNEFVRMSTLEYKDGSHARPGRIVFRRYIMPSIMAMPQISPQDCVAAAQRLCEQLIDIEDLGMYTVEKKIVIASKSHIMDSPNQRKDKSTYVVPIIFNIRGSKPLSLVRNVNTSYFPPVYLMLAMLSEIYLLASRPSRCYALQCQQLIFPFDPAGRTGRTWSRDEVQISCAGEPYLVGLTED